MSMAVHPIARSLWLSSRRTTALLQHSFLSTGYSPACRNIHRTCIVLNDAEPAQPQVTVGQEAPKKPRKGKPKGAKPKEQKISKTKASRAVEEVTKRGRKPKKTVLEALEEPEEVDDEQYNIVPNLSLDYNLPGIPYLDLPPMHGWKKGFSDVPMKHLRPTIRNPDTAMMLAEKFIPEGSRDKIVIEASSGPGQLSRALLRLPRERIKKLIIIESVEPYIKYVEPLKQIDDRVTVIKAEARDWSTYTTIRNQGILDDVEIADWDPIHPQLHFIMQMGGGVDAEQVASQLLRTIPDRQWLFKFGRMPMNLILTDRMYERLIAAEDTPGEKSDNIRCKVSVMAQAVAKLSETVPYQSLQPYWKHFHPERFRAQEDRYSALDSRKPGNPRVAMEVIPFQQSLIKSGDLDFWDYVTRKLFVMKATPIEQSITALGPGANNLLKKLQDTTGPEQPFDVTKSPRQLNIQEWNRMVEVFKAWPFRPQNLGIEQMFAKD